MTKEVYIKIKQRLESLCENAAGERFIIPDETDVDPWPRVIRHVDLWNRNIEFIEQEAGWERPAVFVEFEPVRWEALTEGSGEYRATARVRLHVVADWAPATGGDADHATAGLLDFPALVGGLVDGLRGENFSGLRLVESHVNHDHEDIVESVEVYEFTAYRSVQRS